MIRLINKKILLLSTLIILGFTGCFNDEKETQKNQKQQVALPVKAFTISKKNNITNKTYPTILKAYEKVDVIARVSGTLEEKHFNEGEYVKKGQLLYKIEPDTYLAQFQMQKANFTKAQKDYKRAKSLLESKSISNQTYDDYVYKYESSKAALKEAQINLNYTNVTAPINGIVGIKKHTIGDLVGTSSNNMHLITITNTNPIYAEFSLPKEDLNSFLLQIKEHKVDVNLLTNDKVYKNGKIDFIDSVIDSSTDTLLLRAKFDNPNEELIAGNFTKIQLANLSLGDVFIIPENAVLKTAKTSIVYVIDENNIAKVRPVQTGSLVKEGVVIKGGLKAGEKIISSNLAKVKPETKIQIINKDN